MSLFQKTNLIYQESQLCLARHLQMREDDSTPDFFETVKPHADHWHLFLIQWREESRLWIEQNRPKYIRIQQIDAAIEAFNQYLVQSFYKETGKKRFAQSIQSTCYTLQAFMDAIEQIGEKQNAN
ncbi:MAG: DUF1798 family protein [Paenisporosarcina sp.]